MTLSFKQAVTELQRLKALNDGKEYCITINFNGGLRVGEKTQEQKAIELNDNKLFNKKITDFLQEDQNNERFD